MSASRIIRWGFVAAGKMAAAMAADLRHAPGCQVAGVFSRTAESAAGFARQFGGQTYGSLDAMVADASIDVVYISSPNNLHYPQAKAALEAGKPVLCEKTFTLSAAQLESLITLARSKHLFLMEAMWVRWLPVDVRLRQLLAEGAIGRPLHLQAAFHSRLPVAPENRFYNPALGGGALLDLGIYPISFASQVFGRQPVRIASSVVMAETGVDQRFAAIFEYGDGGLAQVSAGFDAYMRQDIALIGSEGSLSIELNRGGWRQRKLHVTSRSGKTKTFDLPYKGSGYGYQAAEVARCLNAGLLESDVLPLDESLAIMHTLDALRAQWGMRFPDEGV
jgi:predicted dehydrogenase